MGDDVRHLQRLGLDGDGWDPGHRPDVPRHPADVVNLGYVLNVIEDVGELDETLRAAWGLWQKVLSLPKVDRVVRDERACLADIIEACDAIAVAVRGLELPGCEANRLVRSPGRT